MNASDFASMWIVHPELSFAELYPPALMVCVMDRDPTIAYLKNLREQKRASESNPLFAGVVMEGQKKAIEMVAWDRVFRDVTADRLSLLYQADKQPEGFLEPSGKLSIKYAKPFVAIAITSNEPAGPRWLVSKTAQYEGAPVCWCVPFVTKIAQSIPVVLAKDNRYDLEKGYTEIFGA